MNRRNITRAHWHMSMAVLIIFAVVGCAGQPGVSTLPPAPTATQAAPSVPKTGLEATATSTSATDPNVLYQDDFTNPGTGWPEDQFDNYFVGYHEPEYYHIEVTSPHYKAPIIVEPGKHTLNDATVELQVFTNSGKTAPEGDFRYGLVFRRSGDQYYAFTVSQRSKKWYFLKSSPTGLEVLKEGTDGSIHDLDVADTLRVDAQGSSFFVHINDHLVDEINDSSYASGEVGFYVESFDSPRTHIHFDKLTIRKYEAPVQGTESTTLYKDDFTNPSSGWPERTFDGYFIGYHEPEYYHIEVTSPNYRTTVFEPKHGNFGGATIELEAFTNSAKTAPNGDFRYGLAFRRSGDQYYAFAVSQRTKKWYVLKSSPNQLITLQEGTDDGIHDPDVGDLLRVDAKGSNFLFHINDRLITQISDPDYASGEVGFYVETFDSPRVHIHFDTLTIREVELALSCDVRGGTLYVRSGPGKTFAQTGILVDGDSIKALGISPNKWIKIVMEGSDEPGWVSYVEGYMFCTPTVDLFPIITQ